MVKVVMLGASGVGKTAILQQFVWNTFSPEHLPTDRKHTYYPSVIINGHLYELHIADLPVIPYFPVNSYKEWSDFRFYGLRSATAYVLVFDLSNADTFQYVRMIREQMMESRDLRSVPVLVVGNKQDLLVLPPQTNPSSSTSSSGAAPGCVPNNIGATSGGGPGATGGGSGSGSGEYREKRRDIVSLVKKHWKCGYVECSAKYNWRIVAVFHELMRSIDNSDRTVSKETAPMLQNAIERNKCVIL